MSNISTLPGAPAGCLHTDGRQELAFQFRLYPTTIKNAFEAELRDHDKKFNPSGQLHTSAECRVQGKRDREPLTVEDEQGVPFPVQDSDPKSIVELGEISRVQGTGLFDLAVNGEGHLFVIGMDDGILPTNVELCQARGGFAVGMPAKEAREKKTALDWKITDLDHLLSATCKPTFDRAWTTRPSPVGDFLTYLEEEGCVRVKVIQHLVEKVDGKFTINPQDDTAFVLEAGAKYKAKPNVQCLGNLVDFKLVQNSPHIFWVHRVCYEKPQNLVKSGYPGIFLKKDFRIKKGDIFKLTAS